MKIIHTSIITSSGIIMFLLFLPKAPIRPVMMVARPINILSRHSFRHSFNGHLDYSCQLRYTKERSSLQATHQNLDRHKLDFMCHGM